MSGKTIDGVPRDHLISGELLERLKNAPSIRAHGEALDELRALLDAPAVESELDRLRAENERLLAGFYQQVTDADIKKISDYMGNPDMPTGAFLRQDAYDLANMTTHMCREVQALRNKLAAQPQGEPVAAPALYVSRESFDDEACVGMHVTKYPTPVQDMPLYAEQPAPVAIEGGEPYAYEYEFATVLYKDGPGKFKKVITNEAPDQHEIDAGCIINVKPLYSKDGRKYDDTLLPFLALMRKELNENSGKGDREGWLGMAPGDALSEIHHHTSKLADAVRDGDNPGIREHAADVANCAMMLLDVCHGLPRNN